MTMRRNRPKKKYILSLSALLAAAVIGSTYAYFSQDLSAENQFLTGKYDTDIKEEFDPPNNWMPGVEIPKSVQIENTGDVPVVAVAMFTESCVRKEDVTITDYVASEDGKTILEKEKFVGKKGDVLPVRFPVDADDSNTAPDNWQDIALKDYGPDVIEFDESVPGSEDAARYKGKWVHFRQAAPDDPKKVQNYFLYVGVIGGGETSPELLKSVTLNPLLKTTLTDTKMVANVNEEGEGRYTYTNTVNKYGYDSVNYKLTVNAKTVQATQAAVDEVLGTSETLPTDMIPEEFAPLLDYVRNMCSGGKPANRGTN